MATLTEVVATVVVHSSAAAFSHFGVTLDAVQPPAPQQKVIARTRQPVSDKVVRPDKAAKASAYQGPTDRA